jgi:arsenate reductase
MAAAFFNMLANPQNARAISAGTDPAERVHPEVVTVMRDAGIDLTGAKTTRLSPDLAHRADMLVTMGCGDKCPIGPGAKRDDWPLDDPQGKPIEQVRAIRDQIHGRVELLIQQEDWW